MPPPGTPDGSGPLTVMVEGPASVAGPWRQSPVDDRLGGGVFVVFFGVGVVVVVFFGVGFGVAFGFGGAGT